MRKRESDTNTIKSLSSNKRSPYTNFTHDSQKSNRLPRKPNLQSVNYSQEPKATSQPLYLMKTAWFAKKPPHPLSHATKNQPFHEIRNQSVGSLKKLNCHIHKNISQLQIASNPAHMNKKIYIWKKKKRIIKISNNV